MAQITINTVEIKKDSKQKEYALVNATRKNGLLHRALNIPVFENTGDIEGLKGAKKGDVLCEGQFETVVCAPYEAYGRTNTTVTMLIQPGETVAAALAKRGLTPVVTPAEEVTEVA